MPRLLFHNEIFKCGDVFKLDHSNESKLMAYVFTYIIKGPISTVQLVYFELMTLQGMIIILVNIKNLIWLSSIPKHIFDQVLYKTPIKHCTKFEITAKPSGLSEQLQQKEST